MPRTWTAKDWQVFLAEKSPQELLEIHRKLKGEAHPREAEILAALGKQKAKNVRRLESGAENGRVARYGAGVAVKGSAMALEYLGDLQMLAGKGRTFPYGITKALYDIALALRGSG